MKKKRMARPSGKFFYVSVPPAMSESFQKILIGDSVGRGNMTPVMFYRSKKTKKIHTWWAGGKVRAIQ